MAISHHTRPKGMALVDWHQQTLDELEELDRLTELNSALTGPSRAKIFEIISADEWSLLRKKREENLQRVLDAFPLCCRAASKEEFIDEMARHTNDFVLRYLETHLTELPESGNQFYKDLGTIAPNPPLVKTLKGNCGPTFCAVYPRWAYRTQLHPERKTEDGVACILKWTHSYEIASHRLYEAFATGFTGVRGSYPDEFFCVPKMIAFDQNSDCMDEGHGLHKVEKKTATKLKSLFESLTQNYHQQPKITPPSLPIVMRQEKVKGQNLSDFIRNRYTSLTLPQKKSLFRRIGRMAFLDFVLGHNDRLVPVETMSCAFGNNDANLGNLMVCEAPDGFGLFAIDNGINAHLCNPENQRVYLNLLSTVLSSNQFDKILSEQVKIGIKESLNQESGLEIFNEDLETIGREHIQKGLKQMDSLMTQSLGRAWSSPSNDPLKTHLEELHPGMPTIIDDRIRVATTSALERSSPDSLDFNKSHGSRQTPLNASVILQEEDLRQGTPIINLLWTINQHCRGSLEDTQFFNGAVVPLKDEVPAIQTIYDLFYKIRNEGVSNKEDLISLKTLTEEVLRNHFGIQVGHDSPMPHRSAPTPSDTPNPPRALSRLSFSSQLTDRDLTSPLHHQGPDQKLEESPYKQSPKQKQLFPSPKPRREPD